MKANAPPPTVYIYTHGSILTFPGCSEVEYAGTSVLIFVDAQKVRHVVAGCWEIRYAPERRGTGRFTP